MSHIMFLEDKDLNRIVDVLGHHIHLERGHILFHDNNIPDSMCELIVKENYNRHKIKANVGLVQTAEGIKTLPTSILSNRNYSGSLALGNLEDAVVEGLRQVYVSGDRGIDAEKYDFYSKIVGKSREDLLGISPTALQATTAILGAFGGVLYEPGLGPVIVGTGLGGMLAAAYIYSGERWQQSHDFPHVEQIKQMLHL